MKVEVKTEGGESTTSPIELIFSQPWTVRILRALLSSPTLSRRSGEIATLCGESQTGKHISPKTQSERLKWLVEQGLVTRMQSHTIPPAVTYYLTAEGQELSSAIKGLDKYFKVDQGNAQRSV